MVCKAMKKLLCISLFLCLAVGVYANVPAGRTLFIEGTAPDHQTWQFFTDNFRLEATALLYTVTNTRAEAAFTFRFNVTPNFVTWADGSTTRAPAGEPQYIITINFIRNEDNMEIVSFNFAYEQLFDMFAHNQFLVFMAIINNPDHFGEGGDWGEFEVWRSYFESGDVEVWRTHYEQAERLDAWRRQWLYLRLSADFPITFYALHQNDYMIDRRAIYAGPFEAPTAVMPVENRVVAWPGATIGLELQVLEWFNVELNFQVGLGNPRPQAFYFNMAAGLELKFPLRFVHGAKITPFAALSYSLSPHFVPSESYYSFPNLAVGGGLQVGFRAGNSGSFFINASFMHHIGNVQMNNFSLDFPLPEVIPFRRYVIGIGIGYKIGIVREPPRWWPGQR